MRCVQLTQDLAEQNREVGAVADIWKELTVVGGVVVPVNSVEVGVVEFVLDLTCHVVEDIFALSRRAAVVGSLELDWIRAALGEVNLLHALAADHEEIVTLGIGHKRA